MFRLMCKAPSQASKIKNESYYVKHLNLFYRPHTSTGIRILREILSNVNIYFYQEDMNGVRYDKIFYIISFP